MILHTVSNKCAHAGFVFEKLTQFIPYSLIRYSRASGTVLPNGVKVAV